MAFVSLAVNALPLAWLVARQPKSPEGAPSTVPVSPATPPAAVWTRELAPFAALGSFMTEKNRVADLKWSPAQFAAFQEGFRASYGAWPAARGGGCEIA